MATERAEHAAGERERAKERLAAAEEANDIDLMDIWRRRRRH